MQLSSRFIRISGLTPEVKKKPALVNDWENIIAYWEESAQCEALVNKLGFFHFLIIFFFSFYKAYNNTNIIFVINKK